MKSISKLTRDDIRSLDSTGLLYVLYPEFVPVFYDEAGAKTNQQAMEQSQQEEQEYGIYLSEYLY